MPQQPEPWTQLPRESGPAYEAFCIFLELGAQRSVAEVVRRVRKRESLVWRWAGRHDWRHRAWLHDQHQARQDATVVRQHRQAILQERLDDLDRMARLSMVYLRGRVRRDPETGEASFDRLFTPQLALRFVELALKALGAFNRPGPEDKADERPAADLFGLADAELMELIDLARERADQHDHRKDYEDESDQDSRQQEQHEQQEDEQDNDDGE